MDIGDTEIRFKISKKFIDGLKKKLKKKNYNGVMQEALDILDWCVEKTEQRQHICAVNDKSQIIERITSPALSQIRRDAADYKKNPAPSVLKSHNSSHSFKLSECI